MKQVLEKEVLLKGGIMIYLGSDDENSKHPFEFYQKQGYKIVEVFPDANGIEKPDIWMAKRLAN